MSPNSNEDLAAPFGAVPDKNPSPVNVLPWLTLSHIPGMHSRLYNKLLDTFKSPEAILSADMGQLVATGMKTELANHIKKAGQDTLGEAFHQTLADSMAWAERDGHSIIPLHSSDYPGLLGAIPDPPPLLYVKGNPGILGEAMIAMVGSRRPTVDGRRNARRFAAEIAAHGLGVCSGLALGIDVESHAGALAEKGKTVAVLGTGIDEIYPAANRDMFDCIAREGALVTEFNPGTRPRPEHFPRRNRIISGLSLGVVVVEASMKSGSMITAKLALEQGREVFAIPGSIHNPMAKGCHRLITEGARLVQQVSEILDECAAPFLGSVATRTTARDTLQRTLPPLTRLQKTVLAAIGRDPVLTDVLVSESGLPIEQINAALTELELLGLITRESGGLVSSMDWA